MLNQLSEVAPASAVIALLGWGAFSYGLGGPEIAHRISNADYVPACEASLGQSFSASSEGAIAETQRATELERQARVAQGTINSMRQQYGDLLDAYDGLMGGAISRSMREAESLANQAEQARERARKVIEARRDAAIASAPDQCSCQITAALNESRNDWAFYVGSFGLVEQEGVTQFASRMRANAKMCAERLQV
ncbi:hypothetical protein SAMN04488077_1313 [Roseovarius tolerans]|uniref:Uncharacterized protein n=1 Tax=Roseovarius tolerans TaxID=74031 RepID=A0A1H8JFY2_9RHOB|nr:hypothetical protein [Roseovarius tolerans]SEN79602.1 hypothetical protein SAMN04488077_1313 [Roseovarius tolerans]